MPAFVVSRGPAAAAVACLLLALPLQADAEVSVSAGVASASPDGRTVLVNGVFLEGIGLVYDWGDGTTSQGFFPHPHHYEQSGTYQVQVTAIGPPGDVAVASFVHVVPEPATNVAAVTLSDYFVGLKPGESSSVAIAAVDGFGNAVPVTEGSVQTYALHLDSPAPMSVAVQGSNVILTAGSLQGDAWAGAVRVYVDGRASAPLRFAINKNEGTFHTVYGDNTAYYLPEAFFSTSAIPDSDQREVLERAWAIQRASNVMESADLRGQVVSYAPPVFGGSGNPLLLGDPALPVGGTPYYDVVFHEMGHNSHGVPVLFNHLGIPGAFYQETLAEWYMQYTQRTLVEQQSAGLLADTIERLQQIGEANRAYHAQELASYIAQGAVFDYMATAGGSHPLVGQIHRYSGVLGWDKLPSFMHLFDLAKYPAYAPILNAHGGKEPEINRVTFFLRALGETFGCDVRPDFVPLNFPINDGLYQELDAALSPTPVATTPAIAAAPPSHDFGESRVLALRGPVRSFEVSNQDCGPLSIATIALDGSGASSFEVLADGCSGQTLPWARTCTVEVAFLPSAAGTFTASLAVQSTDPDGPLHIALSGVGVDAGGSSGAGGDASGSGGDAGSSTGGSTEGAGGSGNGRGASGCDACAAARTPSATRAPFAVALLLCLAAAARRRRAGDGKNRLAIGVHRAQ